MSIKSLQMSKATNHAIKLFSEKPTSSSQMLSIINPNHFGSSKTSNSQNPKIAEISPKIALARASSVKSSTILERLRMRSTETLTSDDFKTSFSAPKIAPKTTENSKMNKPENFKNSTQKSSVSTVTSKNGSEKINIPVPKPRSRSISRNASANSRSVFLI